ncbi:nop domain-containing protein [Ceraceosorus bombacis]|uniref:Nucleolar protein 58 n=1 Tax=Ceraceosorus bombacis TaxID=401625 RepID=A0A0P1BH48_9BASI|nr:nop domain-containing protein [Ceraceosorus bombacis]
MVLVLFETAVGFCLFRLSEPGALTSKDLHKQFESADSASRLVKLSAIHRFQSTAEAVEDVSALGDGKMSKGLKKFLTSEIVDAQQKEQLVVTDPKLGGTISKKLGIQVTSDSSVLELYRGIRQHLAPLLSLSSPDGATSNGLDPRDLNTMSLGLSHSLSRYKLKFSPDKVDTMVVQAVGLLDDLDKELNIYAMRVKEWYGWHFPEMGKLITDNIAYSKCVLAMGFRTSCSTTDFSEILPEELEETLKAAAEISMGTEISDTDLSHISSLAEQVVKIGAYRAQLWSYLQTRMANIAPNLTALVGELVGARLISHAGSLLNLAKHPASTVQILGAEKALFRALKTKHDTPKYGLIYHSSLVGQAPQKLKGKMARMVATKAALSIRLDALADAEAETAPTIGLQERGRLEARLRGLEHRTDVAGLRSGPGAGPKQTAFTPSGGRTYNAAADSVPARQFGTPSSNAAAASSSSKPMDVDAVPNGEAKLSKEERKAQKKARKSAAAESEVDLSITQTDASAELSKEERKAAKKAAKAAAAAQDAGAADASTLLTEEQKKKEKKEKKKRAAEAEAAETDGDAFKREKKKKRKSEGA